MSPLHNRCLALFAKLAKDGGEVYWDNLYPSRDVAQKLAKGATYETEIPAGPDAGKKVTIVVPKTGTCGTARTNRGIDPKCRQPDKSGKNALSKNALAELKAKPLEERVKSSMTKSEPRVVCVSVFDNGPVHMISTIHKQGDRIVTISRKRFNASTKKVEPTPIERLEMIDDYNKTMDFVDIADQLGNYYHLDGHMWRDRKWWMPIFKWLFKLACDQGYVLYKRVCEKEEQARAAAEAARAAAQAQAARPNGSPASATRSAATRSRKIEPMSHFRFLEMISEGLVIEAYNSTKRNDADKISLDAYDLERLEQALAELRGEAAPSSAARGGTTAGAPHAHASQGKGKGVKRKLAAEADGTCPAASLESNEPHYLIDKAEAIKQDYIKKKAHNYCMYKFCPHAAANKAQKSGTKAKSGQYQAGRARGTCFCPHPKCKKGFHALCAAKYHKWCD